MKFPKSEETTAFIGALITGLLSEAPDNEINLSVHSITKHAAPLSVLRIEITSPADSNLTRHDVEVQEIYSCKDPVKHGENLVEDLINYQRKSRL